jgi:phosphoenolpyruvate carboxylase
VQTNSRLAQLDFKLRSHYERELSKLNSCFENSIRGLQSQKALNVSSLHRHEETSKVALQMNRHAINALMSKCHALVNDIDRMNQSLATVNPDHFFKTLDARRSELSSIRKTLHSKAAQGELFGFEGKR